VKRIAVTGTTGRVGAALARHLAADHHVIPLPRSGCDLADRQRLAATLDRLDCDIFINPAGVTSLEACEDDPATAFRINAEAPGEIAAWAASRGISLFHFSTDYVFDGKLPGLRGEEEPAAPLSVYGHSKLAGEEAVLAHPGHRVIRVSWVFGPEKPSFVDLVFEQALASKPLAAIADKFSLPVFTRDLAEWIAQMIPSDRCGRFHACQSGEPASWHDMACAVVHEMAASDVIPKPPEVARQHLTEMTAFRAPRPRFTALDTRRLTELLGHPPRDWRDALVEYVRFRCASL
jgi:dTDP-4-dehydrorhamnose reductase